MYNKENDKYKIVLGFRLALGLLVYILMVSFKTSILGPLNEVVNTPAEGAFIFIITSVVLAILYSAILQLTRLLMRNQKDDKAYIVRKANFKEAVRDVSKYMGRIMLFAISIEFVSVWMRAILLIPIFVSIYYEDLMLAKDAFINSKNDKNVDTSSE